MDNCTQYCTNIGTELVNEKYERAYQYHCHMWPPKLPPPIELCMQAKADLRSGDDFRTSIGCEVQTTAWTFLPQNSSVGYQRSAADGQDQARDAEAA